LDFVRIRETQHEYLLHLLKVSIGCIKISLILPAMGSDLENTKKHLQGTLYEPAIKMVQRLQHLDKVNDQVVNKEILQSILYFQRQYAMYKLFPRLINQLSEEDKALIVAMETLYKVTKRHISRTAKAELEMERQMCEMYSKREEITARTTKMRQKLKSRAAVLRWKQACKSLTLNRMESELVQRKKVNRDALNRNMYVFYIYSNFIFANPFNDIRYLYSDRINRATVEYRKNSVLRQKSIEEVLEKATEHRDRLAATIAHKQKEICAEKNKLLIQLEVLIQKFDGNIVEKIRENLELGDQYVEAKKELDAFMKTYRREEKIYNRIVGQYELEQKRKHEDRILSFMMDRAARKIQNYWIAWRKAKLKRERKQEKLMSKKKK
ncbi:hypothetical protein KR222_010474, partial [Zaprionus bogoriensis]